MASMGNKAGPMGRMGRALEVVGECRTLSCGGVAVKVHEETGLSLFVTKAENYYGCL